MEKAIIVLTGTPSSKGLFDKIITQTSYRWNINPKNHLAEVARSKLYWSGTAERGEEYHRKLAALTEFVNREFNFETLYVQQLIERFKTFDAEEMVLKNENATKVFTKFLLVIHGISKDLTKKLASEEGAVQVHVTSRKLNTVVYNSDMTEQSKPRHDLVFYDDDKTFETDIQNLINTLTQQKEN